jgi:hypothetical protein
MNMALLSCIASVPHRSRAVTQELRAGLLDVTGNGDGPPPACVAALA